MVRPFHIGIAGLTARLDPLFDYAEEFCKDYIVPAAPTDIVAVSSRDAVEAEHRAVPGSRIETAETICLYRQIAEQLPAFDAFVFHGAAIEYGGKAYLFTAPSGTGKSTHISLWRKHLGDAVRIVNGDKPILRLTADGVDVCSTPWAGKEGWQRNCIVPLGGICLLRRGEVDRIVQDAPGHHFSALINQVYWPSDRQALDRTLSVLDVVAERVPFYVLDCTISERAVAVAFEALTGGTYCEHS